METKTFEEWIDLGEAETSRTYYWGDGRTHTVTAPKLLFVKKSGSHKITDMGGKLHYIRKDWIAFSADGEWKFNVG